MKIRKRDITGIMFVLVLFSAFLFQGCGNSNSGLENADSSDNVDSSNNVIQGDSLLYFSNDVSIIKVTRFNGGGEDSWNLKKEDIPQFREWVLSLQLEYQDFENGESPGDYFGGEGCNFQITGDTPLNFSYVDNGDDNPYMRIEGEWYSITNYNSLPDFILDK